jgi:hypothetical protein
MNPMLSLEDKAILAEKHAKKKSDAQKRGISILLRDIMAHKVAPLIKKRHTFGRLHIQTIFDEPVSLQREQPTSGICSVHSDSFFYRQNV